MKRWYCPGCRKPTRSRVIAGVRVIELCADCTVEEKEAKKLTASCSHAVVRRGTCVVCGALQCEDGTWEPPMRRPRIRRVV